MEETNHNLEKAKADWMDDMAECCERCGRKLTGEEFYFCDECGDEEVGNEKPHT